MVILENNIFMQKLDFVKLCTELFSVIWDKLMRNLSYYNKNKNKIHGGTIYMTINLWKLYTIFTTKCLFFFAKFVIMNDKCK